MIGFLKAKNFRAAGIHRQIVEVCGEGAMNERSVRKWYGLFREGTVMRDQTPPAIHANYSEQFQRRIFEHPSHSSDIAQVIIT